MNKLKFLFRFALAWALFAFASVGTANAQCVITAKAEGCVGVPQNFSVSGPALLNNDSIVWTFPNGSAKGASSTNVWNTATGGAVVVTVKVYSNGSVTPCTATFNVTIYENPVADFKLLSPSPQCFNGNSFQFQDDSKTPSGNPVVWREFVYGDGGKRLDSTAIGIPAVIGPYKYTPPTPLGGNFDPSMQIRDSKGCVSFISKTALITIKPDLGTDFTTPNPTNCKVTNATFTNTSLINQANVKRFIWTFGDTASAPDSTTWTNLTHKYTQNGCFNARLIIESLDGCLDTAIKQAACNVNPTLNVTVANGDVQCHSGQNFVFDHPVIQIAQSFLWNFDDPPTGLLNFDNKNWNTTHDFSAPGPYDVGFRVTIAGCNFDTVYRVHVKGPGAGIESKPSPIIAPSQRYQCKITDTVYFPNVSKYYFNDDSAFNDFFYTLDATKAIFQFIDKNTAHIDFDTINLKLGTPRSFTTKTGRQVYVSAAADTVAVGADTLILNGAFLVKGAKVSSIDAFHNNGKHVDRVWDFADNVAPKCTTDSRPIYPINQAKYGNGHFPGPLAPAWTYDVNGKWINCGFSRDSLPKHWYTPGEERCYQVRLMLKDTSSPDPNIQASTASGNDPSGAKACESVATVQLALQGPDASGLEWEGIPCYGPANIYGFFYKFDKTGPACDRQQFWIHFDSLADRKDNTPNVFDKWIPQTGTVVDRMFTPWPMATLGLPPNVGRVFWQYQPNGAYPSKISDPAGWATIGFRVQNGIDPLTGQPCIDEKWYDSAYRYINANPAFQFNSDPNKPDSLYTFERICSPNDVKVKRDPTFWPNTNTYTYSSDSIGAEIWNWGDGEIEIDSFIRYNPIGGLLYSYRIRYLLSGNNAPVKIDSVLTRIYDPVLGKSTFVDARDSTPDIYREHRFKTPAWNRVEHTIVPCQKLPFDSLDNLGNLIKVYRKVCCDNPPFGTTRIAISGFLSYLNSTDSIVCRNTPIQFFDSARYYLEFPIPVAPYIIDSYDFWDKAKQVFLNDGVTPRPRPRPSPKDFEKLRWNFGDGSGWNASVPDNPTRSFPDPGIYNVQVEYTDSFACKQVMTKKITVTGVSANFTFNRALQQCRPTVDFTDETLMLDPCRLVGAGVPCDDIQSWRWDFGDNKPNNQSVSILQNPSKVYTSFGDFDVVLIVQTRLGCIDSIKRTISLEGPRPRFEFAADSVGCVPFTVELRNTSINPTSSAKWTWNFGDGKSVNTFTDSNVTHTYDSAGVFEIFLLQEDITPLGGGVNCFATFPDTALTLGTYRKFIVRVLPSRKTGFNISDTVLCVGDSTQFTSTADGIYSTYRWIWGDGDTTILDTLNGGRQQYHQYNKAGTFYIQLRPSYIPAPGEPACPTSAVRKITVAEVKADFLCDTVNRPDRYFKNLSVNAQQVFWDFGTGDGYVDGSTLPFFPDGTHNYGEKQGSYTVKLKVISPEGCEAETQCTLDYQFKTTFDPPNIFTPGDENSLNDLFEVDVENEEEYNVAIFNRWGEKVFEADDKNTKWDGKHMGSGGDCPAGVYFVVINYRLRGKSDQTYRGTLTLKRQ